MKNLSIFLSHSHKDLEKIRKIRDFLETIECEPLMFYLKCLDDDTEILEDFIKREIEARNIFIYCKSIHSENSKWVQKEIEYIRSLDEKRLYTIDIDNMSYGLLKLMLDIVNLIQRNKIYIYSSKRSHEIDIIESFLESKGFSIEVIIEDFCDVSFIGKVANTAHEIAEFQKYKEYILPILNEKQRKMFNQLKNINSNGIFMPILHEEQFWIRRFLINNVVNNMERILQHNNNYICKIATSSNGIHYSGVNGEKMDILFNMDDQDRSLNDIYNFLLSL